jgi:hypothetical protein
MTSGIPESISFSCPESIDISPDDDNARTLAIHTPEPAVLRQKQPQVAYRVVVRKPREHPEVVVCTGIARDTAATNPSGQSRRVPGMECQRREVARPGRFCASQQVCREALRVGQCCRLGSKPQPEASTSAIWSNRTPG